MIPLGLGTGHGVEAKDFKQALVDVQLSGYASHGSDWNSVRGGEKSWSLPHVAWKFQCAVPSLILDHVRTYFTIHGIKFADERLRTIHSSMMW